MWSSTGATGDGLPELDPLTGRTVGYDLPGFLDGDPIGLYTRTHLVRLPEDSPESPLGSKDGLAGFRVFRPDPGAEDWTPEFLEGTDGRRAAFRSLGNHTHWGVLRMPEGTAEGLLTLCVRPRAATVVRCRDTGDDSDVWQVGVHPRVGADERADDAQLPLMPPPAFWHFLTPRDPAASRILRGVDADTARQLIDAALSVPAPEGHVCGAGLLTTSVRHSPTRRAAVRGALARLLPQITDEALADGTGGLVWAVLWAADLRLRREEMSRRAALVRADAPLRPGTGTTDAALEKALSGLFDPRALSFAYSSGDQTSTLTALAADGARLRGRIDECTRRLSPPEPPARWSDLLDCTDVLLWRLAAGCPDPSTHDALVSLLRLWAEQPFAEQGTAWVRGRAPGAAIAPLLAAGQAVVTDPPGSPSRAPDSRVRHWSGRYVRYRSYTYVRAASAPVPAKAEEETPLHVERDEAARMRQFLGLLDQRDPVVFGPDAVKAFRAATRVTKGTAEFVLSDRFGWPKAEPERGPARAEYRRTGARLHPSQIRRMLCAAVPGDPAELWRPGGTAAAAERMGRVWAEVLGIQPIRAERAAAKAGAGSPAPGREPS